MRFRQIDLPVDDPSGWTSWMTRELDLPPHPVMPDAVVVGWSTLRFRYMPGAEPPAEPDTPDATTKRGHHLAFAVPTGTVDDFSTSFGSEVVDRPGGEFAMRSVYITGPENAVLEFVEHAGRPVNGDAPQLLGVAEVGLGVPDVRAVGDALADHYGDRLPHGFGDPDRRVLAAYGDIDGAVVVAVDDRPWFPTEDTFPVTTRPRILVDQGR
jgi:hypothetical protein